MARFEDLYREEGLDSHSYRSLRSPVGEWTNIFRGRRAASLGDVKSSSGMLLHTGVEHVTPILPQSLGHRPRERAVREPPHDTPEVETDEC